MELTTEQRHTLETILLALPRSPLIRYCLVEGDPQIVCAEPVSIEFIRRGWWPIEGGLRTVQFNRLDGVVEGPRDREHPALTLESVRQNLERLAGEVQRLNVIYDRLTALERDLCREQVAEQVRSKNY